MKTPHVKTLLSAFVAASPLALLAPQEATANPIIEYTHPAGTYLANGQKTTAPVTRRVDCSKFYKQPSTGRLFFTPEVSSQIDIEGAQIGKPVDLKQPESVVIPALTQNTVAWFSHLAEAHGQCRAQYLGVVQRAGGQRPFNSQGWENQKNCPHLEVAQMCKQALER